jgi:hypothetical protein
MDGASTQYLRNAAPAITDYPFSVGMWFWIASSSASARVLFTLTDTGSTTNYISIKTQAAELVQQSANDGTSNTQTATSGSNLEVGEWTYIVSRFIATNERRSSIWNPAAATIPILNMGGSVTAKTPTGMDTMLIGAGELSTGVEEPWDGAVAEFWLADGDVGNAGAHIDQAALVQLALGGPFAMPSIASKVVDYRSFIDGVRSPCDNMGTNGAFGRRQTWTPNGGTLRLSPHPPLPYWYVRPGQTTRSLVI